MKAALILIALFIPNLLLAQEPTKEVVINSYAKFVGTWEVPTGQEFELSKIGDEKYQWTMDGEPFALVAWDQGRNALAAVGFSPDGAFVDVYKLVGDGPTFEIKRVVGDQPKTTMKLTGPKTAMYQREGEDAVEFKKK